MACLDQKVLDDLAADREGTRFTMDEALIVEGESASDVFLLVDAVVKVTVELNQGTTLLAVRVGGDIVGEMAVIDGDICSATVTASRNEITAVAVPGDEFRSVMDRSPATARLLASDLSRKLRASNRRRADFTARKVPARVARVLAEMADDYGRSIQGRTERILQIGLSQEEFATLIGAREAAVSDALRNLRTRGILRWGYKTVTIYDMDALRAAGDSA